MTSPALTESDPISPRAEALEDPLQYIPGTKTPPSWRLGGASAKSECPLHQDNDGQGASRPATVDQPQDSAQHPSLISRPALARLMGDPLPSMPGTPLIPDWPRGHSHILGGQRPALHDADVQGAALGHGAQP